MPGSYKAPIKTDSMIDQDTIPRMTYNPVTHSKSAVQHMQTVPYISQAPYKHNTVPIINPDLRVKSQIISNLPAHIDQSTENSVNFTLERTTAGESTSYHRVGSPRRREFSTDSHSKVSGWQSGISRLSSSGDMVARQRFASEEDESSSSTETIRELNRKNDKTQSRQQMEEPAGSYSSFSESLEHSSNSSVVISKLQTQRHNVDRQNETLDLEEFEGLCEQLGIFQVEDRFTLDVSNRPI